MELRTNSPRVRYPIGYARVMGERPRTWLAVPRDAGTVGVTVRANEVLGAFPTGRAPILPVRLRTAATAGVAYRRPHYHRAACGHAVPCAPVKGICPRLATRARPECSAGACKIG